MKKYVVVLLSVLVAASMLLSACAPAATPTTAPAAPAATTAPAAPAATAAPATTGTAVGIVLPTKDEPRWIQDQTRFSDALTAAGFTSEILFSQGDSAKEKANVESLLTKGIKVLIICPQDAAAAGAAVDEARKAGVKVISYDRLVTGTDAVDFYVTFDSMSVGKAQADYLVSKNTAKGTPLYLYAGAASDNNAFLFFEGAWEVLQPKIADGTFVIKNSTEAVGLQANAKLTRDQESKIIGQVTTNWDFNTAKNLAEANLTAATAADKGTVAILAPNDGTARAIADAFAADKDVKGYTVTGQDAEKASVQYIIDGKQSMTVFKDVRTLVKDAITAAVTMLGGGTPKATSSYDNGKAKIPAAPSAVVTVDKSNVKAALVDSGYYKDTDFTGLTGGAAAATGSFVGEKLAAPDCNYGGNIKSVEATDQYTVTFNFCTPDPAFIAKISSVESFDIYSEANLKATGGDTTKINAAPVGTGPYIVKEWVRGDHITFVPNPTYFGDKAANTTFTLKWNKEAAARLLDLQAGNTTGIVEVTADDLATIKADPNLALVPRKLNDFLYMGISNLVAPFDNEKVRQAFAMAINKQKIVDDFYAPGSVAATQFVQAGVEPGYTKGYQGTTYDPAKAKQMLVDAKFDFSKEYTLSYAERTRPYFPQPTKIVQAIQAQFATIGVKIKLDMQEWATYLPATRTGKMGLFMLGWGEDYPDATDWYDVFLAGSSKSFGSPYPDIVPLIKQASQLGDPAARQALYDQVNKLYDQHVPMIVIAHGTTNLAFLASAQNVVVGPYNENFPYIKTADGNLVFEQDGEPVSLSCADETDGNSFRTCELIYSKLYRFDWGTANPVPDLAEKCTPNADATSYVCTLKKGVTFSDGTAFSANDVVASFSAGLDYKSPLRKGSTGDYQYFKDLFGPKILNQPAQ